MTNKFQTFPIDKLIDKHIGLRRTEKREAFENELRIGAMIIYNVL